MKKITEMESKVALLTTENANIKKEKETSIAKSEELKAELDALKAASADSDQGR